MKSKIYLALLAATVLTVIGISTAVAREKAVKSCCIPGSECCNGGACCE